MKSHCLPQALRVVCTCIHGVATPYDLLNLLYFPFQCACVFFRFNNFHLSTVFFISFPSMITSLPNLLPKHIVNISVIILFNAVLKQEPVFPFPALLTCAMLYCPRFLVLYFTFNYNSIMVMLYLYVL